MSPVAGVITGGASVQPEQESVTDLTPPRRALRQAGLEVSKPNSSRDPTDCSVARAREAYVIEPDTFKRKEGERKERNVKP